MKIALYIEDGLEQIVLTPESPTEQAILGKLHDGSRRLDIKRGEFYECRGGWVRHGLMVGKSEPDASTMIVLRPLQPASDGPADNPQPDQQRIHVHDERSAGDL